MSKMNPEISIIIPCRNEEKHIGKVIEDLINNNSDQPIEILVIDGMSTDGTRKIVQDYAEKYPDKVKLIDNPDKYVPHALNRGIKAARGNILIRMDAHAIYPPDYIKKLINYLEKTDAWNVGPSVEPTPAGNSPIQKAIAVAQKSLFGVGNSLWRRGVKKPTYADTTPFFCIRKEIFDKVGFFNERLIRNQDAEFNARIIKAGGRNLVVPDVRIKVISRNSWSKLAKQYFQYGYYRALSTKILKKAFSFRQFVPPLFFSVALFSLILSMWIKKAIYFTLILVLTYSLGSISFSIYESFKHRYFPLVFTLPPTYFIIHSAFAAGFVTGYIKFFMLNKEKIK